MSFKGEVVILSAPSGGGKTSLMRHCLEKFKKLRPSVSCTTRKPRENEKDAQDYFFLSTEEFQQKIEQDAFLEYEEVYKGVFYGTLRSEIDAIWALGCSVIFDVDVKGGLNLKRIYGEKALSVFVSPPSIEVLKERLLGRNTESPEAMRIRLEKAAQEISYAGQFDKIIVNDDLDKAKREIEELVNLFTKGG